MLEIVGNPRAVNPDRALRRIAQQRGWPVLTFGALRAAPARTLSASGM
jgi:phosphoserine phosphatase